MPFTAKNILVTSGGWQGALSTLQSLGRLGHRIYLLVNSPDIPAVHSKYCKGFFISPRIEQENEYLDFVHKRLKEIPFDALIPISDQAVALFSRHRDQFQALTKIVLPDINTVNVVANKTNIYRFALKNNIPIPETYFPESIQDVRTVSQKNVFPCFIKYPTGSAGTNNFLIETPEKLIHFFDTRAHTEPWPVIQKKINGDFYGLTGVSHQGTILDYFSFYTDYQYSQGGTPPNSYSCRQAGLLRAAGRLIKQLNYTGAFDLDYLKGPEDEFLLLEINPRFSGTLNFSYKMGINLPETLLNLIFEKIEPKPLEKSYKEGVLHRSIFPHEILWCYKTKKHLQFWLNFLKLGSKTNIYWDDPKLLMAQIKESYWAVQHYKNKINEKNKIP